MVFLYLEKDKFSVKLYNTNMQDNWVNLLKDAVSTAYEMPKMASNGIKHFSVEIADVDRYTSDRYEIHVTFSPVKNGYSVSSHINNAQLGIAGYMEYWHYKNKSQADATFEKVKNICKAEVAILNKEKPPMAVISTTIRSALANVDPGFKEKSGVFLFNKYITDVEKAPDHRTTIYGNRYPKAFTEPINSGWIDVERSREIQHTGKGRQSAKKYLYSFDVAPTKPQNAPLIDKEAAQAILKEIMDQDANDENRLDPVTRNKAWGYVIAKKLKERGVPNELMNWLHNMYMTSSMSYLASTSNKYKVSFAS